jgi:hypothetical protein
MDKPIERDRDALRGIRLSSGIDDYSQPLRIGTIASSQFLRDTLAAHLSFRLKGSLDRPRLSEVDLENCVEFS